MQACKRHANARQQMSTTVCALAADQARAPQQRDVGAHKAKDRNIAQLLAQAPRLDLPWPAVELCRRSGNKREEAVGVQSGAGTESLELLDAVNDDGVVVLRRRHPAQRAARMV